MIQDVTRDYLNFPAVLTVRTVDGRILCSTDHFLLTAINETDQERISAHYTAGEPSVYVGAGRQPMINTYMGTLVDTTVNGELMALWLYMYNRFFRGTKCVRSKAMVELLMRDQYRKGYLVSSKLIHAADALNKADFTFGMFVISKGSAKWPGEFKLRAS